MAESPTTPGVELVPACWVFALLLVCPVIAGAAPSVSWLGVEPGEAVEAPEGHAWLRWAADGEMVADSFILEQNSPGLSPMVRHIDDTSTFLSGLPSGTTEVRIRALTEGVEGPWSDRLLIVVSYPSTRLVWMLGGLGTLLLGATISLIVSGHRATRRQSAEGAR